MARGKPLDAMLEARLDPALQRQLARQAEAARHACRRRVARQFEQGERVAARLGEDPLAHARVQRRADDRREELARRRVRKPGEPQIRQPRQLVGIGRLTHREQQQDRLGLQAPGDEGKHLCRRPIEPLGVVDQAQQRRLLGSLGHEAQRREADQEAIGLLARAQPERGLERVALRQRQPLEAVEQRAAQLMQAGERKLHLRLDAHRANDARTVGTLRCVIE